MHPLWVGVSLQIRMEWSQLGQDLLNCDWFKHNQIIFISWSVIKFLLILRVPPGGWWVGGLGWGWACGGWCPMHACMHMHTHLHAHACCKHDKHGCFHGGWPFAISIHVYMSVHAYRHLPPTCPLPKAAGSPKHQNSISPELIEIFQFCLKILYL